MVRRSYPLTRLLPAALAALVLLSVIPVIVVSYIIASDTTERLVAAERESTLDQIETQFRSLLDPVKIQIDFAAKLFSTGEIEITDEDQLRSFMRGLLGATPQVRSIGFLRPDGSLRRWERSNNLSFEVAAAELSRVESTLARLERERLGSWRPAFYSIPLEDIILNYRAPIIVKGEFIGAILVAVTAQGLSQYVDDISKQLNVTAFVLSGRDRLVAYPGRDLGEGLSSPRELTSLAQSINPIVRSVWTENRPIQDANFQRSAGHWTMVEDRPYGYVHRSISNYGPMPYTIVAASPSAETRWDRWSAAIAALVGLVFASMSIAIAWWLGRRMIKPITQIDEALLALAASKYGSVRLEGLASSPVQEWQRMGAQVDRTADALLRLTRYVPNALNRQLMGLERPNTELSERTVSIIFLDLEGFTNFATNHSSRECADYLELLFGVVGPIIEDSGGVIDKYTGDGLLAFWGAPDRQDNHAQQALWASTEIRREWTVPVTAGPRIRIGLHTGNVLVGDVGFEGRVDYTLIGETVNTAERVQSSLRGTATELSVVVAATPAFIDHVEKIPDWLQITTTGSS